MRKIFIINTFLLIIFFVMLIFSVERSYKKINALNSDLKDSIYQLAWPGILPDNKIYKLKVLRNKIVGKLIMNSIKKIEFNLLMADKTIYASELLVQKGKIPLAKDTALKGENYYSNVVQDYNITLLNGNKISSELTKKILLAGKKHQEIFKKLEEQVNNEDKKTFQIVGSFSRINYDLVVGLASSRK